MRRPPSLFSPDEQTMTEVEPERDVVEPEPERPPFPLEDLLNPTYDWMGDGPQPEPRRRDQSPQHQQRQQLPQHHEYQQQHEQQPDRGAWTTTSSTNPQIGPNHWAQATLDLTPIQAATTTHWGMWALVIPSLLVVLCGALLYIAANL